MTVGLLSFAYVPTSPVGKNQVSLAGVTAGLGIFTWLNIWKQSGDLQINISLSLSGGSITWLAGTATVTTPSPHGFPVGTTWNLAIQGASPSAYNTSGNSAACAITGASTFTYAIASNPGSFVSGNYGYGLFAGNAPNSPNSIWGQNNNLTQHLDANGDVQANITGLSSMTRTFYTIGQNTQPAGYTRNGQQFVLSWTGGGSATGAVVLVAGAPAASTSPYNFTWQTSWDTASPTVLFSNIDITNPPINISICLAANSAALAAGGVYEPVYVQMLSTFAGVIRFMDLQSTNSNRGTFKFADIPTESYFDWTSNACLTPVKRGIPVSVMAKLANAANKHPWVNIPDKFGTPKYALVSSFARSASVGSPTIVITQYLHTFLSGDLIIPYVVGGNGTTNSGWGVQATITFNIGSNLVNWTAHGFANGQNVYFTGGTLPSNVNANQSYYVTNVTANTFQVASTIANALAGTAITLAGSPSGTITGTSQINRNAFVVGNVTANTIELLHCDSTNFGASVPSNGYLTAPFSTAGMTTEVGLFASAFIAQLNPLLVPRFEYGNENWSTTDAFAWLAAQAHNFVDGSGVQAFPGDNTYKMSGYLYAHMAKTIRDAYGGSGGRAKWQGVLSTLTVNTTVTSGMLSGINYYLANFAPASGLVITDICNNLANADYYGGSFKSNGTAGSFANVTISVGANALVKLASGSSSLPIGTPFIFSTTGALPAPIVAWTQAVPPAFSSGIYWSTSLDTGTGFTISATNNGDGTFGANVNTTGGSQSGVHTCKTGFASLTTNWMTDSIANFLASPGTYPTIYTYFNITANQDVLDGRWTGGSQSFPVIANSHTPSQGINGLAAAQAALLPTGINLVMYEGGNGNYMQGLTPGGAAMTSDTTSIPSGSWGAASGYATFWPKCIGTAEDASNWTAMVAQLAAFSGTGASSQAVTASYPSQFVDCAYQNSTFSFGAYTYVDHFQGFSSPVGSAVVATN